MKIMNLVETFGTKAAFANGGVPACARDSVVLGARAPMPRVDHIASVAAAARKRLDDNQRTYMIQAGAMGAGASGPSPWGCPV